MYHRSALLSLALLLSACGGATPPLGGGSDLRVVNNTGLPAPSGTDLLDQARPYLVGPLDKLVIDVFGIEELSRKEVQTDAAGRFSFPLAGVVAASGKTPTEIEQILAERLRANGVRNPQVTVNLRETVSQVITVDGQVQQPGMYPIVGRMTLMRAIATARGTGEFAKLDDVVVFRNVDGQRYAALYNLAAIRRGVYADPEIFGNDVVVVGDSPSRRMFKNLLTVAPLLTTPLVVLLQRN